MNLKMQSTNFGVDKDNGCQLGMVKTPLYKLIISKFGSKVDVSYCYSLIKKKYEGEMSTFLSYVFIFMEKSIWIVLLLVYCCVSEKRINYGNFVGKEKRIVDEYGRERLFHGVNVVFKGRFIWFKMNEKFHHITQSLTDSTRF